MLALIKNLINKASKICMITCVSLGNEAYITENFCNLKL